MKYIATVIACFYVLPLFSQQVTSRRIEEIGKALDYTLIDTMGILAINDSTHFKIRANYNEQKQLTHLGLLLFEDIDSIAVSKDLLLFFERELLDLYLSKNREQVMQKLNTDRLSISFNGNDYEFGPSWSIQDGINSLAHFTQMRVSRDPKNYLVSFSSNRDVLALQFPANIQVIRGMDKRELDNAFISFLCTDTLLTDKELYPLVKNEPLTFLGDGIFLRKGGNYVIDEVNSDRFYENSNGYLKLAYNPEFPIETLRNLFYQDNEKTRKITFTIGQRLYNGEYKFHSLSLGAFARAAQSQYTLYTGVEEDSEEGMVLTLLLQNTTNNAVHIFEVNTNEHMLFESDNIEILAKARTYIPTDNVETLFGDRIENGNNTLPKYDVTIKKK